MFCVLLWTNASETLILRFVFGSLVHCLLHCLLLRTISTYNTIFSVCAGTVHKHVKILCRTVHEVNVFNQYVQRTHSIVYCNP